MAKVEPSITIVDEPKIVARTPLMFVSVGAPMGGNPIVVPGPIICDGLMEKTCPPTVIVVRPPVGVKVWPPMTATPGSMTMGTPFRVRVVS